MKKTGINGTVVRKITFAGSTVQYIYPIPFILIGEIRTSPDKHWEKTWNKHRRYLKHPYQGYLADTALARLSGRTSKLQIGIADSDNRATTLRVTFSPLTSLNMPNINGAIALPPTAIV